MEPTDVTVEILKAIRDELRSTRTELSSRLDGTNTRLDRLERRQTETDIHLSTEVVAMRGAVEQLRDVLLADRDLRARVEDHERRISAIEKSSS